ncbi:hypothetical protein FKP32DRAFT_1680825 [Trametes sanguinea]|nr:hypothetical protein FKP32DRAFT_1680825 [Trametes sanguinea]
MIRPSIPVQKLVARGQRGDRTGAPVQAISAQFQSFVPHYPSPLVPGGPVVGLPSSGRNIGMPGPPSFQTGALCAVPPAVGYNVNHLLYQDKRAQAAKTAYASNLELITIGFWMMLQPSSQNGQPKVVGNITETINQVSVHIGARELKKLAWQELYPAWQRFSEGFRLSLDDLVLRDQKWAKIVPREPDCDVIAHEFFKEKKPGAGLKFDPSKKTKVFLHLPDYIWVELESYLSDCEDVSSADNNVYDSETRTSKTEKRSVSEKSVMAPAVPIREPGPISVPNAGTAMQPPTVAGSQPTRSTINHESLFNALSKQQLSGAASGISSLFNMSSITVQVRPILKYDSLDALSRISSSAGGLDYIGASVPGRLMLDTSPATSKHGTFKRAQFGTLTTDVALFLPREHDQFSSVDICAKQAFFLSPEGRRFPHQGHKQARLLMSDIQCLVWAQTLLRTAYEYIEEVTSGPGWEGPSPEVPQLRFVQAALAITDSVPKDKATAYLIEEVIDVPTSGKKWHKYINNDSAKTLPQYNKEANLRAQFLAFTQHVQLWRTRGMAFVTDYQGWGSLLTDPQIVTNPKLNGNLFAAGNLPEAHAEFVNDHKCNDFCVKFQVPGKTELTTMLREWDNALEDLHTATSGLPSLTVSQHNAQ